MCCQIVSYACVRAFNTVQDNMHTSLHESIKTRFLLHRLDERNTPLSLGDKKALRLSHGRRVLSGEVAPALGLAI